MSAKKRYAVLEAERSPYLDRARDCSALTIPTLLPPSGSDGAFKFKTPYQSVGARGVANLSSSLLLSLIPPNQPFFRLSVDEEMLQQMEGYEQIKPHLDASLSSIERAIMREIEVNSFRVGLSDALKQLIVSGNVLLHIPKNGRMKVFRLDSYVVQRDDRGNPVRAITKENVAYSALSPELQALADQYQMSAQSSTSGKKSCELYTVAHWTKKKVEVHQELYDMPIPGSEGSYPLDKPPVLVLRFVPEQGQDYGRSYVEQYYGDLKALEGLSQAVVAGAAAASKVLFLCSPNGTTRPRDVAKAGNGAIISGSANDISVLQMQKYNDFRVALDMMGDIKERLNYAFLLTEASIRRAERVTAEEVRLVSAAIENQLGSLDRLMRQELQVPVLNRLMDRMSRQGQLPELPAKYIKPAIVAGMDALGRGTDLAKLDTFVGGIGQVLGPQMIERYVNLSEYLRRRATALAVDTVGLVKTEEQIAQEAQQAMMQQTAQQTIPGIADKVAGGMAQSAQRMAEQPPTEQ